MLQDDLFYKVISKDPVLRSEITFESKKMIKKMLSKNRVLVTLNVKFQNLKFQNTLLSYREAQ